MINSNSPKELVLKAVRLNGLLLEYAHEDLKLSTLMKVNNIDTYKSASKIIYNKYKQKIDEAEEKIETFRNIASTLGQAIKNNNNLFFFLQRVFFPYCQKIISFQNLYLQ